MKRIDDKIKEIEKKDKTNRIIFIILVAIVAAIYVFLTQQNIDNLKGEITEKDVKLTETYKDLEKEKERAEQALVDLQNSLDPGEYWEFTKTENSVQGYIDYLTNVWGIKRDSIDLALNKLNALPSNDISVVSGWLYVGKDTNNNPYESAGVIEVVWRDGVLAADSIKHTMPKPNDIVKYIGNRNRRTYQNRYLSGNANTSGWRPGMKALVTNYYMDGAEYRIEVKYN